MALTHVHGEVTPSESTVRDDIKIEVLHPEQLLEDSRKDIMKNINRLVNDAYSIHGHPNDEGKYHTEPLFVELRITTEDQLVHELGPDGLIAICTDQSLSIKGHNTGASFPALEPYQPGMYGQVIAVACIKPWTAKKILLFKMAQEAIKDGNASVNDIELTRLAKEYQSSKNITSESWDWEVSTCASVKDSKYRRQGLIIRSLDAVIARLKTRHQELKAQGDPRGDLPIKLWSSSLEGSGNTEYWLRRGFVKEGEPDIAPKGMWTSVREFQIQTLSKVLT